MGPLFASAGAGRAPPRRTCVFLSSMDTPLHRGKKRGASIPAVWTGRDGWPTGPALIHIYHALVLSRESPLPCG
jgi:hypothetical protein